MASNISQESNLAMHLQLASMAWAESWRTPPAEPQGTTDTGRLYSSEEQKDVKNVWLPKKVAQAQTQNPDIGPVVDPLSHIRWSRRNQLIRSSNPSVEQQGKSEHSGNFKS